MKSEKLDFRDTTGRGGVLKPILWVVGSFFAFCFFMTCFSRMRESQNFHNRERVKVDISNLRVQISNYHEKHGVWPPARPFADAPEFAEVESELKQEWVRGAELMSLAPSNEISALLDPYSPNKTLGYAYCTIGAGWVLFSPGPDGDYDFTPRDMSDRTTETLQVELASLAYDPSNGVFSNGDIFLVNRNPAK